MWIYVDGALSVTKTFPAPLSTGSDSEPMVIGRADTGRIVASLDGVLNSVRVHGGLLSSNDVLMNYLAGSREWNSEPVTVLKQPEDAFTPEGSNAVFTVLATDDAPLSFQWYSNGTRIPGATNSTYILTNVSWSGSGSQFVSSPLKTSMLSFGVWSTSLKLVS